jgi:ribulose-phosphate 3-epimerase
MGVNPGYGGQELIPACVDKIKELIDMRDNYNYHYFISLDGGVNGDTRKLLDGLDIIVSGSFVCMSDNYQLKINELK